MLHITHRNFCEKEKCLRKNHICTVHKKSVLDQDTNPRNHRIECGSDFSQLLCNQVEGEHLASYSYMKKTLQFMDF